MWELAKESPTSEMSKQDPLFDERPARIHAERLARQPGSQQENPFRADVQIVRLQPDWLTVLFRGMRSHGISR